MSAQPIKRGRITAFNPNGAQPTPVDVNLLNNEKAERAVLGAVFQRPDLFPTLSHLLQPGDFWTLFHGLVWYVLDRMVANDQPIDIVTIADAIEQEKGNPYKRPEELISALSSLYGAAPDVEHAEDYARQVREAALKMRVLQALDETKHAILTGKLNGEELKDTVNQRIFEATEQSVEAATDVTSMMIDYVNSFEGSRGAPIATGLHHLDAALHGGVFRGEVTVVCGGEGMGKTTFLLSLLRTCGLKGVPGTLFSMEMERKEIAQAYTAMETGIERAKLQAGKLSPGDHAAMTTAAGVIGSWKLHVVDMREFPALTPIQLRRKLRSIMTKMRIEVVVLDGLWLMQPSEPTKERFTAVFDIMRDLSTIAKDFDVAVVIAQQYTEGIRRVEMPTIYHIAESAGVRRNAQVIIGLWRASFFDKDESDETLAFLMKDRNRGANGSVPIPFNKTFNRFDNGR